LAYAFAESFGGSRFISVFCASLAISTTSCLICKPIYEFTETEGQLLVLLIFTVFGAVAVWPYLPNINWQILLYSVMSLTVVRVVAVAISLIGTQLQRETILFLGWFGPRGIASLLFRLLVLGGAEKS
jgi:NhaP-type Na+/H+ or K+/H+ antiporter